MTGHQTLTMPCSRFLTRDRTWLVCWFGLLVVGIGSWTQFTFAESPSDSTSSSPIGLTVRSFYVRAITGPLAGKSVCYVCRNGLRPSVLVITRDLEPETVRLIKQLDGAVNQHRADGLRCFVVLISDSISRDSPKLQTIAFNEKLDLPLTIAAEAAVDQTALLMPPDATLQVTLYHELKIVDRHQFRIGECNTEASQSIITSTNQLLKSSN